MVSCWQLQHALVAVGEVRKRHTREGGASNGPSRLHLHLAALGQAGWDRLPHLPGGPTPTLPLPDPHDLTESSLSPVNLCLLINEMGIISAPFS